VAIHTRLCLVGEHGVAEPLSEADIGVLIDKVLADNRIPTKKRLSFGNLSRIRNVSTLWAQQVEVPTSRRDPQGWLCTPEGPIGVVEQVQDAVYTGKTGVAAGADYADWEAVVCDWMSGDPEAVEWLQMAFGAAAFGYGPQLRKVLLHIGSGRNGKSLLHAVLREALGNMAGSCSVNSLLALERGKDGSAPSADVVAMAGRRLIIASETDLGFRVDAKSLKTFAGGLDEVVARKPYAVEPITFRPTFLLSLSTNYLPTMPGHDQALWDRLVIIPWNKRYDHNPLEERRIMALAGQALRWMVDGARKFVGDDLLLPPVPAGWKATSDQARTDSDPLAEWIQTNLRPVRANGAWMPMCDIYDTYKGYAEDIGAPVPAANALAYSLKRAGYEKRHTRKGNEWNCRRAEDTDFLEPPDPDNLFGEMDQ